MNVNFHIEFTPRARELLKSNGIPPRLGAAIARAMDRANQDTLVVIKSKLNVAGKSKLGRKESLSRYYPYPHKITGRLQRSMDATQTAIQSTGKSFRVMSRMGSGVAGGKEPVRYAAIQEYGGNVIVPSRVSKKTRKPTKAYTVKIPARPFLNTTVRERMANYSYAISRAVQNFWGK